MYFWLLSGRYTRTKFGGDRQVVAGRIALNALTIQEDIASLQAFGHLGAGKDEIDAPRRCGCRAGKAQRLGMDTPIRIYITGFLQESNAAAWRVQTGG